MLVLNVDAIALPFSSMIYGLVMYHVGASLLSYKQNVFCVRYGGKYFLRIVAVIILPLK